jgi:hypothetical protein
MDDALLMCRFERRGDLTGDPQRLVHRHRPLQDAIGERRAIDELHDERHRRLA